jgi:hypothetical protein
MKTRKTKNLIPYIKYAKKNGLRAFLKNDKLVVEDEQTTWIMW